MALAQSHSHDGADAQSVLIILTLAGMTAALVSQFVWPGWWGMAGLVAVYLAAGVPTLISALVILFRRFRLDIDLLMVLAALAAAAVGSPLEGAVLLTLFAISETLETRAMGRARRAVEALMAMRPDTAFLLTADGQVEVASDSLNPGDVVVVRPGGRIPVDGVIRAGSALMDLSSITGESVPVRRAEGEKVFEATVNLNGVLEVTVARTVAESTVARMVTLVTEAQAAKAPSEQFSDWFGQRYTLMVLAGSVAAFLILMGLGRELDDALYRSATLLVAASPCAVVISVPAAILSALSAAARGGVLFKGGAALERLAAVKAFAFDKTGTLTTGRAEVTGVHAADAAQFLALLAGLEANSEHPIADAIRREVSARGLAAAPVSGIVALPSEGITGRDAAGALWAGNARLAARMGADLPMIDGASDGAETLIWLGRGPEVLGAVTVADRPRASSRDALVQLRAQGMRVALMTGDRRSVADRIGAELGFKADEIHAELLPEDKVRLVAELGNGGHIAFVGDGVNDAAALARADVGIAMGAAGSEVALQAADVALLSDEMGQLAAAQRLARRTARIIRQNLIFALGAMVVLVIGGLFFNLPLPLAVLGHEGGTVLVVLNGLRLLADPVRSDRR